jgi:deoxyguanosine kinase
MLEIDILEGARGTGKSTLAFKLRQRVPETTLINFTGFHADGEDGLKKIHHYYSAWMKLLENLSDHESKFVFDRFYFTEMVFSHLYKEYDFTKIYKLLNQSLMDLTRYGGVKVNIFFLTISNEEELKNRLHRDKVGFANVKDSTEETILQQYMYQILFSPIGLAFSENKNLNIYKIDTSNKSNEKVFDEIMELKATN